MKISFKKKFFILVINITITIIIMIISITIAFSQTENIIMYNTFNTGLPSNYINSLATDKNGNLWIGMN